MSTQRLVARALGLLLLLGVRTADAVPVLVQAQAVYGADEVRFELLFNQSLNGYGFDPVTRTGWTFEVELLARPWTPAAPGQMFSISPYAYTSSDPSDYSIRWMTEEVAALTMFEPIGHEQTQGVVPLSTMADRAFYFTIPLSFLGGDDGQFTYDVWTFEGPISAGEYRGFESVSAASSPKTILPVPDAGSSFAMLAGAIGVMGLGRAARRRWI